MGQLSLYANSLGGEAGVSFSVWSGILASLARHTQLQYLELVMDTRDHPPHVWQTVLTILKGLGSLDRLRLYTRFDCAIPEDALMHAAACGPVLRRLDVYHTPRVMEGEPHISLNAFMSMVSQCPHLEYTNLNITYVPLPSGELVAHVKMLHHLPVDGISLQDVTHVKDVARLLHHVFPNLGYVRPTRSPINVNDERVEDVCQALASMMKNRTEA